mmetsp:Transcript_20656/g.24604  ORF Transcript_20656/g.24604 Transcript_20656/m.24604 type:complete len:309 (+) Transcript_20656:241-1167(+)
MKVDGPVTIADIRAQKTITENLLALYPSLVIKGEESDKSMENVDAASKPEELTDAIRNLLKNETIQQKHTDRASFIEGLHKAGVFGEDEISSKSFETFNTSEATVWIDPLDGTSDYCRGNISAVTVLIGLTINDYSRIGVIHFPFIALPDKSKGMTLFGTGEHGCYSVNYTAGMTPQEMAARVPEYMAPFEGAPDEDFEVRVAVSSNRPAEPEMMAVIAPSTGVGLGGCGNKSAQLLLDNADAYITSGLNYWDICACEPLIRARGGNVFLGNMDKIKYVAGRDYIDGLNASRTVACKALMDSRRAAKL